MMYDRAFKKIFGNNEKPERLEAFLSVYLNIPFEDIKGTVTIIDSERRINTYNSKRETMDIIADTLIEDDKYRINIEINMFEKNVVRNAIYAFTLLSGNIRNKESYSKIPHLIQINFDKFDVIPNGKIIDRYFLKNEDNEVLTDILEIDHVNIEKCYKACYDKNVSEDNKQIILLGALVYCKKIREIEKCLEGIKMEKEIKDDILDAALEYSEDPEEVFFYNKELDDWKVREGAMEEAKLEGRQIGLEEGRAEGRAAGREIGLKEGREIGLKEGHAEGLKEGHAEGLKEGRIGERKEIAEKMLDNNISLEMISKITGYSLEELKKLEAKR